MPNPRSRRASQTARRDSRPLDAPVSPDGGLATLRSPGHLRAPEVIEQLEALRREHVSASLPGSGSPLAPPPPSDHERHERFVSWLRNYAPPGPAAPDSGHSGPHGNERLLVVAATSFAEAAGLFLATPYYLSHLCAKPVQTRLALGLSLLMPACRWIRLTFPVIGGHVAGLEFRSVEYFGYKGASAAQIVAQMADRLEQHSERLSTGFVLDRQYIERRARMIQNDFPSPFEEWLGNNLGAELAALGRELGSNVADRLYEARRPSALAAGERMLIGELGPPGHVVLAAERAQELSVHFASDVHAIVRERGIEEHVCGRRNVSVFRRVFEAHGEEVAWDALLRADMIDAGAELSRRDRNSPSPVLALQRESLQRAGRRVRTALGKLGYHWEQDGRGARWSRNATG